MSELEENILESAEERFCIMTESDISDYKALEFVCKKYGEKYAKILENKYCKGSEWYYKKLTDKLQTFGNEGKSQKEIVIKVDDKYYNFQDFDFLISDENVYLDLKD